jgi:hypothetical protein
MQSTICCRGKGDNKFMYRVNENAFNSFQLAKVHKNDKNLSFVGISKGICGEGPLPINLCQ